MNINLREAIVKRVQGKNSEELVDVVAGSVGGDERALPGLGVLFEIIWENSDDHVRSDMIETLKSHLPPGA